MKIIKNTLKAVVESWDDPGDPHVLGGPLESYKYVAEVDGSVKVSLSDDEVDELKELLEDKDTDDWIQKLCLKFPDGVSSGIWRIRLADNLAIITLDDVDSDVSFFEEHDGQ